MMRAHTDSLDQATLTSPIGAFLLQAALWNVALFGAIRIAWIDGLIVGPLVEFQKALVFWYGATPHPGIIVNSTCSGADLMALCAGVLLAYPLAWRRRLAGAAIGLGLILTLNAIRIASLYAVASTPHTLKLLHVYVWPPVLVLATVVYVFAWIRWNEPHARGRRGRWARFGYAAIGGLAVYAAMAPWALTSPALLAAGAWTAQAASMVLGGLGTTASAAGTVLMTPRGAFQVTQECLFTPAIPLYLAAVFALPLSRRSRTAWLALALPVFFVLGVARVLVLALPAQVVASPIVLAHGFYQLLAGVVVLFTAAHVATWHTTGLRASWRALAAIGVALVSGAAAAGIWHPLLVHAAEAAQAWVPATLVPLASAGDPQGALRLFPAFQVALVTGLWFALTIERRGRRARTLVAALAGLAGLQVAFLAGLGTVTTWMDVAPHTLIVRAWALGVPLVFAAAWALPSQGSSVGDRSYQRFWQGVGEAFPVLTGAASTRFYFENEKRLLTEALPSLDGCTLLKTDLWDEAKNTRIMQWAAGQGANVYGIDLSEPIVRQARASFDGRPLRPVVSDVRRLPFAPGSFDAIYSMGTIEHFDETEAAVAELARILRPGGRLILGVPNRRDPFLRPLLVAVLGPLGLYAYGYEKSYSRRALRRMLEGAGLDVRMESGILFMPGWLRMLDLWCHTRARPLARVTGALVQPFAWLDRHVSGLRRHGYLLASVGEKPGVAGTYGARPAVVGAGSGAPRPRPEVHAATVSVQAGTEYIIDARGCDGDALRSLRRLQEVFSEVCVDLDLHPVGPPLWHVFPGEGGITGLTLLSESHLTIHTYPETGLAAINLYCCRPSAEWDWAPRLAAHLGARDVAVRVVRRGSW